MNSHHYIKCILILFIILQITVSPNMKEKKPPIPNLALKISQLDKILKQGNHDQYVVASIVDNPQRKPLPNIVISYRDYVNQVRGEKFLPTDPEKLKQREKIFNEKRQEINKWNSDVSRSYDKGLFILGDVSDEQLVQNKMNFLGAIETSPGQQQLKKNENIKILNFMKDEGSKI